MATRQDQLSEQLGGGSQTFGAVNVRRPTNIVLGLKVSNSTVLHVRPRPPDFTGVGLNRQVVEAGPSRFAQTATGGIKGDRRALQRGRRRWGCGGRAARWTPSAARWRSRGPCTDEALRNQMAPVGEYHTNHPQSARDSSLVPRGLRTRLAPGTSAETPQTSLWRLWTLWQLVQATVCGSIGG